MSYTMITAIFFATIAVCFSAPVFDVQRNALVRFYANFAQVYRPATLKFNVGEEQTLEQYRFYFPEQEYLRISEESIVMLYTNVIERTITYHSMPNFAVNGSRYFYHRNRKQNFSVEIELVNPDELLFREVDQPNRYFYLPSLDELEYVNQVPVSPYFEVAFLCNTSSSQKELPLLSYIDRGFQYTARYVVDVPPVGTSKQMELQVFADIYYVGEQTFVIKGAELIAGDLNYNLPPLDYFRTGSSSESAFNNVQSLNDSSDFSLTQPLGENARGTYVYELSLPSPLTIPRRSIKSIPFLKTNVTIESFFFYASVFSPVNSEGRVANAYNLTSVDSFLPAGHLISREQGRYIGQIDFSSLLPGETVTNVVESDGDVSYRRQVTMVESDDHRDSVTYYVEYLFENSKPTQDVQVYFVESFSSLKDFRIRNFSAPSNNDNFPAVRRVDTDLRGYVFIPRQGSQTMLSFNLIV